MNLEKLNIYGVAFDSYSDLSSSAKTYSDSMNKVVLPNTLNYDGKATIVV